MANMWLSGEPPGEPVGGLSGGHMSESVNDRVGQWAN